ncbi:MAG TPA: HAMP domain-containing sensor histidine kinase [Marmoricola sp.]|jgi:two-component system sensor histidine kinase BaeS|nr:HAMP domain-containing sensor histidine kinase [Marmoricola sp.]
MTIKPGRVPWHRSLFVRVLAIGAVIALVAIVAATWATARSTTVAVGQERQQSLHAEATTYDRLIGYAATHRTWPGARTLVDRLASQTGHAITIADPTGHVLISSGMSSTTTLVPAQARATVDPLSVDTALIATAGGHRTPSAPAAACQNPCSQFVVASSAPIDARAVGPFGGTPSRTVWANLLNRVDTCLRRSGLGQVLVLQDDFSAVVDYRGGHALVSSCLDQSRRAVLRSYVAPPALLFISGGDPSAAVGWDLSRHSWLQIALVAGLVLLVTLVFCALLAGYVTRPLRTMAAAALRARDGDLSVRVPDARTDEFGQVARAFNTMADRREQLESARTQLVSDVSHELRTPLANIRGWLEATEDGIATLNEQLVVSLLEETLHLQHLVDDLHDLALADANELGLVPQTIELPALLEQLAEAFGAAASHAGVSLEVTAEPGSTVTADPVRIRQAVSNLVANALRHSPSGGTVSLLGVRGSITIADTGEGIPAADVPHVFERFRRADPSRNRRTGGSGLGLAIVRQIAEAHGGSVSLTSTVGSGTRVTIRLP